MQQLRSITLNANGNIRPRRFVKIGSADFGALEADANDRIIGVAGTQSRSGYPGSANAAESGDAVEVLLESAVVELELGDTVSRGGLLKSDADGRGVPIATTGTTIQEYGARALQAGAVGEIIKVIVTTGQIRPALT